MKINDKSNLPDLCRTCAKYGKPLVHTECVFCRDIEFHEEILCDLNRRVQSSKAFQCHAFRPATKPVVSPVRNGEVDVEDQMGPVPVSSLEALLNSDKLKYGRALALQRLRQHSDAVFVELRYHLAWNVTARKPVVVKPSAALDAINDALMACGTRIGGFACVLWLAPDHVHVYAESDGEKSVDMIAREIKRSCAAVFPEIIGGGVGGLGKGCKIWDRAYFAETLG